MSEFEMMPIELLQKQVEEARSNLEAADAGTGKTHMNDAEVLVVKAEIARRLNRMAFYLSQRDCLASEDFAIIAGECRVYLVRKVDMLEAVSIS
jgi:hypothetical protein